MPFNGSYTRIALCPNFSYKASPGSPVIKLIWACSDRSGNPIESFCADITWLEIHKIKMRIEIKLMRIILSLSNNDVLVLQTTIINFKNSKSS